MTLEEYRHNLLDSIQNDALVQNTTPDDVFLETAVDKLENSDVLSDTNLISFQKKGRQNKILRIDGYSIDEADKSLIFITSDYHPEENPQPFNNDRVDQLYSQMRNFLEAVYDKSILDFLDESSDVLPIVKNINYRLTLGGSIASLDQGINRIKFVIITNAPLSARFKSTAMVSNFRKLPVELTIWSIERFYELVRADGEREPVDICFKDYGIPGIPCLKANVKAGSYDAYLGIIPGKVLSDIYCKFGSHILEGNVRAFLSIRGKINRGIRKTTINEPDRFFTYNNGLAATAKGVVFSKDNNGNSLLASLNDFQIINGGQTTAALATCYVRGESKLDNILVPIKITVVTSDDYDEMVQNISRYANSQNKVTDSDFFSNHPFHVSFERFSEKVVPPIKEGALFPTYWFFERSRGKYEQKQFKFTSAKIKAFQQQYPKNQVITKEDLAKYYLAYECKPYIVAGGRAKSMNFFAKEIDNLYNADSTHSLINESFFKKCICCAILFLATNKIVIDATIKDPGDAFDKDKWYAKGGFKMDIIPYTISKLVSSIPNGYSLDLGLIWKKQKTYPSLYDELKKLAKITNAFINNSHGVIPSEYAKKEDTWEQYRKVQIDLGADFVKDLVPISMIEEENKSSRIDSKQSADASLTIKIFDLGQSYWENLIHQGTELGILTSTDRDLLTMAGEMHSSTSPRIPSDKQSEAIWKIKNKIESNV